MPLLTEAGYGNQDNFSSTDTLLTNPDGSSSNGIPLAVAGCAALTP
jgi:hypothetical protein